MLVGHFAGDKLQRSTIVVAAFRLKRLQRNHRNDRSVTRRLSVPFAKGLVDLQSIRQQPGEDEIAFDSRGRQDWPGETESIARVVHQRDPARRSLVGQPDGTADRHGAGRRGFGDVLELGDGRRTRLLPPLNASAGLVDAPAGDHVGRQKARHGKWSLRRNATAAW